MTRLLGANAFQEMIKHSTWHSLLLLCPNIPLAFSRRPGILLYNQTRPPYDDIAQAKVPLLRPPKPPLAQLHLCIARERTNPPAPSQQPRNIRARTSPCSSSSHAAHTVRRRGASHRIPTTANHGASIHLAAQRRRAHHRAMPELRQLLRPRDEAMVRPNPHHTTNHTPHTHTHTPTLTR